MREAEIIETCKEAHQDLKDTYPDLIPEWHEIGFKVNSNKTRLGVTRASRNKYTGVITPRSLEISRYVTTRYDVDMTFRHEMAHWLDYKLGRDSNHDATWKALAVKCGASPNRCNRNKDAFAPPVKRGYTMVCGQDGCDWERPFHRMTQKIRRIQSYPQYYNCPKCKTSKIYFK